MAQPREGAVATGFAARDLPAQRFSVLALWHLLSLDAPCVAALWTLFMARVFRVDVPRSAPLALAVAVWMLYAVDRLADAAAGKAHEERHRFHLRHGTAFAVCWLGCVPVLLLLVMDLPHALRDGWLLLAIPLAAYVGAVHALRIEQFPKEPLIALFFGIAVAMPVISTGVPEGLVPAVALFALLCWLNCAAIAAWESPCSGYLDPVTRLLGQRIELVAAVVILLSACIAGQRGWSSPVAATVGASALALLVLERRRGRTGRVQLRALADAALLTPLVALPLLTWHAR